MIYDNQNKEIITDRLVLRLFQKSDATAVARLCNNYNIYKNTLYLPYPYSIEDAISWIEHHLDNSRLSPTLCVGELNRMNRCP